MTRLQDAARQVSNMQYGSPLHEQRLNELLAALAAEQRQPEMVTRHEANEWADMATNGIQWLKNVRDGHSTVEHALVEMESNLQRIRAEFSSKQPTREELFAFFVEFHEAFQPRMGSTGMAYQAGLRGDDKAIHGRAPTDSPAGKMYAMGCKARALLARMDGGK